MTGITVFFGQVGDTLPRNDLLPMLNRHSHRTSGFGLAEVMASVVLITIVLMGAFNSSFIALSSTAQTEASFDAENLAATAFAELKQNYETLGIPYSHSEDIKERAAVYTVRRELKRVSGYPFCAEAVVTVSWLQGRLERRREQRTILSLKNQLGAGGGL